MNILWITNTVFPDVCKLLKIDIPVIGGWMFAGAKILINLNSEVELAVATLYNGREFQQLKLNNITYFLIPQPKNRFKYSKTLERDWKIVEQEFLPDVIHIHGSEYPHGLAYVNACGNKNVIVSIQGLVSVYEKYYFGGISRIKLFKSITIRDLIRFDTIFLQHKNMMKRGRSEKNILELINHVIGRTEWDKAHVWAINPNAKYHFCNETLRSTFYNHQWELKNCEKHSIFLSQAHYPIKGIHHVIKALPLILKNYPNTKLYVSGNDFVFNKGWKINGFGKYVNGLLKVNKLLDKVVFTGLLNESQMVNMFLKSHIFICPSSIENSPNSIGEAQLLGVPCIASYVGGIPDMITDDITGLLYRFEEIEMLAKKVCDIFSNDELAISLSKKSIKVAELRHDAIKNNERTYSIYKCVCKE